MSASKVGVDNGGLRAESAAGVGLLDSLETTVDLTTPASPYSSDRWHDIDDFPETVPHLPLIEQGASTSDSMHPRAPSSHLLIEPLHNHISVAGRYTSL